MLPTGNDLPLRNEAEVCAEARLNWKILDFEPPFRRLCSAYPLNNRGRVLTESEVQRQQFTVVVFTSVGFPSLREMLPTTQ